MANGFPDDLKPLLPAAEDFKKPKYSFVEMGKGIAGRVTTYLATMEQHKPSAIFPLAGGRDQKAYIMDNILVCLAQRQLEHAKDPIGVMELRIPVLLTGDTVSINCLVAKDVKSYIDLKSVMLACMDETHRNAVKAFYDGVTQSEEVAKSMQKDGFNWRVNEVQEICTFHPYST